MNKLAALALSVALLGTGTVTTFDPASAQDRFNRNDRDRYISRYCEARPGIDDCRNWRSNRARWGDREYRDWYRRNHNNDNDRAAAAIFGLATGALLGGFLSGPLTGGSVGGRDVTAHVERCLARYRSYDPASNTYLGYDGRRHACRL